MNPPISTQQLLAFSTLAEHLHMSRAAKALGLTPSALSHSLRGLEQQLGCTLFERGSGAMKTTPAGDALLERAHLILSELRNLRELAKETPARVQSRLRIAASPTACHYLLPNVLREFVGSFPKMRITMDPCASADAMERVLEGDADFAVCPQPALLNRVSTIPIGRDELRFLVHPAHPWTHRNRAAEIEREQLIAQDKTSDARTLIQQHFQNEGLRVEPFIETSSEEAIKQFVRLGIGIGILPEWVALEELESGSLCSIPIGRKRLTRTWVVLHLRQHKLTIAEELFADLCRSVARDLMGGIR